MPPQTGMSGMAAPVQMNGAPNGVQMTGYPQNGMPANGVPNGMQMNGGPHGMQNMQNGMMNGAPNGMPMNGAPIQMNGHQNGMPMNGTPNGMQNGMNSAMPNGSPLQSPKQKTGHARPNGKTRRARAAQQQDKEAQAAAAAAAAGQPGAVCPVAPPLQEQPGGAGSPKVRPKDGSSPVNGEKGASKYSNGLVDLQSEEQLQWLTDDFFMYQFKCVWCPITVQHNWQTCLYAHNYQDARRNPQMGYGPQPCPHWDKKERAPHYGQRCPNGVLCPYSHGAKEQLYHPQYYKTVICWDFSHTKDGCPRGKLCAFYHKKRSQRRGPQLAALARTDYQQLLHDDAMQYIQSDFGCPPFTSTVHEKDMNMAPSIPISQFAPNVAGMASIGNMPMMGQMGPDVMRDQNSGAYPPDFVWYNEDGQEGPRNGYALANSPHSGSDITVPMGYQPNMSPNGMSDATPVGSPMRGPMNGAQFYKPPQLGLEEPGSPHGPAGPSSPYGDQQGYMAQPMNSPHGVVMVPVMNSPQHGPMPPSPHGPMVQGNMMMMAPTLDQQQAPFGSLYESGPPTTAPPQPKEKKQAQDDDLFDVKSFDSMELYDQAPMPIQPPAGLMINKYGMMTMESALTNSGEGTSASASNSD